MKIISLGWGVQSFTMAAMSALGELPKVDYAIHADTTHESQLTYQFAKKWAPWLEEYGLLVVTVINKYPDEIYKGKSIPAYVLSLNQPPGQAMRTCTDRWKISAMRRWLQSHRNKMPVEQWLGISLDEFQRMKPSKVKYISNTYPLIDLRMTRNDCKEWLKSRGLEVPPRSACTFCPFHSTSEWQRIKENKDDWDEAVSVDNIIRHARPPEELFVHQSRKPLDQVDFRTAEEKGQLSLWDNECTGLCGV
jgi:3'-phosphoadenosine 5'-phosphosulfate sulfotransferase (PAPS reductase)/FAD synthetase